VAGGPEQNGLLFEERAGLAVLQDAFDDEARLVGLVADGDQLRLGSGRPLRPEILGKALGGACGGFTSGKKEIIDSRVKSGDLLFDKLKHGSHTVKTFISISGIGIYGNSGDRWVDESSPASDDFLGDVCKAWEAVANKIASLNIRTVIMRTGVVLDKDEGALPIIAKPVKLFAGAALGSGKQYMSWIHVDDLCSIFLKASEDNSMQGVYNAVAPDPQTNKEFTKILANVLKKPLIFPAVPAFALKLILGEKASIVLEGQRVSCKKILSTGFQFRFAELENALKDIYKT